MRGPLTEARAVALARMGLGLAALLNVREAHVLLMRIADGALRMPVVEQFPAPQPWAIWLVTVVGGGAALALLTGWRTGPAALVLVATNLWVLGSDQQTYSSHRLLALLLLLLLAFTRSDRECALRPSAKQAPAPWPRLLMMTQLSVCYLFAGLSKIHPVFPGGGPFDVWLRVDLPATLDMSMALGTILAELFLAVGLWHARSRGLAVVLGFLLHAGIVVGMAENSLALLAFSLTCVPLYPLFFTPWRPETLLPTPSDVPSSRHDDLTPGATA